MAQRYIMTAFGQDKVGIVADVTEIMYEHDCNLEDSNMTRLKDEFAIIFLFSSPEDNIDDDLKKATQQLEKTKGITAFFRKLDPEIEISNQNVKICHLYVQGIDQCGIVHKVSRYLADNQINIVRLSSKQYKSSGIPFYEIDIEVEVPLDLDFEKFKKGLRKVGDEIRVDIQIQSEEKFF